MSISNVELLSQFGNARPGKVQRLKKFAFIPNDKLERLREIALEEDWGQDLFVLLKYLAIHVEMSIKQEKYAWSDNQLIVSAGSLQTRYGVPIYLAFESNTAKVRQPWYLKWVGDQLRGTQHPEPPEFSEWPEIILSSEIIISTEHILDENAERIPYLLDTPPVAQMCAVVGAIQWSLHRGLYIKQIYLGVPSYFVPLYLQTREDITNPPDLVAPIQIQHNKLLVRTVLVPYMAYDKAPSCPGSGVGASLI